MLDGAKPILLFHRSYQMAARLDGCFDALTNEIGGDVELGVVSDLPSHEVTTTAEFLDRFPTDVLRIADPQVFVHRDQRGLVRRAQEERHEYLAASLPDRPDRDWISAAITLQRDAGATALLTPTGWVSDANPRDRLEALEEWVWETRDQVPDDDLLVNVTLPHAWLADSELRTLLLNEMVESEEPYWYIRVRWGVVSPRYGQLRDENLLRGYRELASTMNLEGKILILPNTGLTGWIAGALGAGGFSTGVSWPEQAFADSPVIKSPKGQPRPPRRIRYFARPLLHTVNLATHLALLEEDEYELCDCPFCEELEADDPDVDPATWDREAAALHYLTQVGRLTVLLNHRNPRAHAHREVTTARAFAGSLKPGALAEGDDRPRHLELWDQILQ